jgi:undecaprenyl diphosphate synthase
MQSTLLSKPHVAIIMDGNGRWAARRSLPREAGHRAGVEAVRSVVEAAPKCGVGTLSLYAFSSDNWRRPEAEISVLMGLLRLYLHRDTPRLAESGVRVDVIGRRDRLPRGVTAAIVRAEELTAKGTRLHLRVALDYSARDAIVSAAARMTNAENFTREDFARRLKGDDAVPDVDLLIRTSGEQRLSDFLLWELAYAELYFTDTMWPDFGADDLSAALIALSKRERRFGGLTSNAAA